MFCFPFGMMIFILLEIAKPGILLAQSQSVQDSTSRPSILQQNVKITGEFGAYGELYGISGRTARRPLSTGRIYFSPTITFFNTFSIPLQFFISSEGVSARQSINQFGINPTWKWGTAHLGDFTERYSDLTLNGINIRGGGLTLHPGAFRFSFIGGITQRAVNGTSQNGAYRRTLWGGRIGIGKQNTSYIDLIFLKSKDNVHSLPQNTSRISVLAPNGNENYAIGSVQLVQWVSVNSSSTVKVELSRDGGNTFELLFDDEPSTGAVNWTVTGPETFQAIIRVTSDDDPGLSDVSDYPFTIGTSGQNPSPEIPSGVTNNFAVTPQENSVLGTAGQFKLPGTPVLFRAGLNGSVFTRDIRTPVINSDSLGIPAFFKSFQDPHAGTSVDYSATLGAEANFSSFNAKLDYKYVGPGYRSPGLSYLISDQQEISALTTFNVAQMRTTLQWAHQNDNLIHQKQFTTSRNRLGLSVGGMLTPFWNSSLSTSYISLKNNSLNDTSRVDFSNFGFNMIENFIISHDQVMRSITGSYGYQNSIDNNPLRNGKNSFNMFNFSLMLGIANNVTLSPALGFFYADFSIGTSTLTTTYSLNGNWITLKNKLNTALSLNLSKIEQRSAFRINLNMNYRLTTRDTVVFTLSQGSYKGYSLSQGDDFNEFMTSLRFSHRF